MKKTFLLLMLLSGFFGTQSSSAQIDPYIGQIIAVGFNFAPHGWMKCEGQILSIAQNTALFSLLGTTYGGNGQTTFALPDLRGKVLVGPGQGPGLSPVVQGELGGSATVTLALNNMPVHNHAINAASSAGNLSDPTGNVVGNSSAFDKEFDTTSNSTMLPTSVVGNSDPVNNMQPYSTLNYIIAVQGIFPPRP